MSGYEPSRFTVLSVYDTGTQEFACRMECAACDPTDPEAVKTWTAPYDLRVLDTVARRHWAKWHTPHCGPLDPGPCGTCDAGR